MAVTHLYNKKMQFKLFKLPVSSSEHGEDEMNKFLRSHRVLQVERHFCPEDGGYLAFLVEYMYGDPEGMAPPAYKKEKKDYSKLLGDKERQRFDAFILKRRELAKSRGIPAYLIFTNEELAELAKMPYLNETNSRKISGIAPSRLKDFVEFFYFSEEDEEGGQPNGKNS